MNNTNVLIIGSGMAALQLAKRLHCHTNVIILTKSTLKDNNSYLAQGGIAAAIGKQDSPIKHYIDTIEAGRNHNNREQVLEMTKAAPVLIKKLREDGCLFDQDHSGSLQLGMEGAHSEKRIVHSGGDGTGRKIIDYFSESLSDNIHVLENMFVYELLVDPLYNYCYGVKAKNQDGVIQNFYADHIVLATGGAGQLFNFTSNARTVTGDGIALAYRAGAEITDMEFIQFHPTLLSKNGNGCGLVSEAVRGEGAILITEDETPIMEGIHPLKDLAPRHIVSQTIYDYLKNGKIVYLDISMIRQFSERFPTITGLCKKNGMDLSSGKLPVVPGSHFLMGGIRVDSYGRTNIQQLYAIGEVASTGIHGANRLASNSLLEGLYLGARLAERIESMNRKPTVLPSNFSKGIVNDIISTLPTIEQIQCSMMENVGIVRQEKGLRKQKEWLEKFGYSQWKTTDLDGVSIGDINRLYMVITSWLMTTSALKRTESRGGHYRTDYPFEDDANWLGKRIIHRQMGIEVEQNEQIEAAFAT
ncbi:L-aspartate oxidase [Cytobacillus spongiae]|uniref:L-aspartate oxidase n=1 Tax=Cytobacillus spongiae TaxID=2901381 RepID=UPI001F44A5E7|nr:L-aspartate oxidase [Cytobacillus spongiae]UII55024.1 L-aspartate oxidase [Cytobacillus spongiae]